ncbi:glycosyltransferase family 2 protein [Sporolactobacillus pectinivorans]|uniref:glycosyltransferase family 2 protein n=1 Tax=Sporolactobacillus pectinivorans TaxID=1591408 RepID=UPI000C2585B8|nr:glycosyltransferase family 2 protein [Sporolactobacillus pectinivorans]
MKKVFCVGMLKNEADIIESYIRYHLNIFDGMVLLDNGSTDRSLEIINQLQTEGLPVYLKQDVSLEYIQGDKTTDLIKYTFDQFGPDLIFPLDVDEFLMAPNYSGNPRKLVNNLSTSKVYYIEREYTYFPINLDENELFIPKRLTFASPIKDYWPKVIVSKKIMDAYSPSISGGNHDLLFDKKNIQTHKLQTLKLRHFPYRSLEQLKSKITVGWINTLASYNYSEGYNYHWHALFDELKKNNFYLNLDTISDHQEKYVPMNLSFCRSLDLKYTTDYEVNAIVNLLNYCESLADNYRQLDKQRREGL